MLLLFFQISFIIKLITMNPFSRAAKILEVSAALSKKPPERDTLNSNCSELKQDHNVGPTGFYAESLSPVAVLSPSELHYNNNEDKLKLL